MKRPPERFRLKAMIEDARVKADQSRKKGLRWTVEVCGQTIDVTLLAYLPQRKAAERWIKRCARSISRGEGSPEISRTQIRAALWDFWKGK